MMRAVLLALCWSGMALAAEAPPGAEACSGCHGAAGGAIPALAGRAPGDVAALMLAYRRGEGSPTLMDRIAKGFSEAEIAAIAAWVVAH